jgi:hypothetical protein
MRIHSENHALKWGRDLGPKDEVLRNNIWQRINLSSLGSKDKKTVNNDKIDRDGLWLTRRMRRS